MSSLSRTFSTPIKDPFAQVRPGKDSLPVDYMPQETIEQLKDDIKNLYQTWAANLHVEEDEDKRLDLWSRILESALARSRQFHQIVLNEEVSPGTHEIKFLVAKPDWLLGIWFPGFYDVFDSVEDGLATLQSLVPLAIANAHQALSRLVRKRASSALKAIAFDSIKGRAPVPPTPTNEYVATLFKLARQEKSRNELRSRTFADLQDLEGQLDGIEGASELFETYNYSNMSNRYSLVDRFTAAALNFIADDFPVMPRPLEVDTSELQAALDEVRDVTEFADEGSTEYRNEGEDDQADDEDLDLTGPDGDAKDYDAMAEKEFLREEVPELYETTPVFFYPDWKAPKSGPLTYREVQPGEILQASQSTQQSQVDAGATSQNLVSTFKRSKGFVTARMLSNKEEDEAERNITSEKVILKAAYKYLKEATSVDKGTLNTKALRDCSEWLGNLTQRSDEAVKSKNKDSKLLVFSGFQMADDWVHVRFLLAALLIEFAKDTGDEQAVKAKVYEAEKILIAIFSIVRSAVDDPLPWFLVLEGVLRKLWRGLVSLQSSPTVFETRLFDELVLWCNGTAINAFVVRLPAADGDTSKVLSNWCKLLYDYDPTCANEDCLRLLTHPDKITGKAFRQVISVGTREARVGRRSVRAFISINRDFAYPCLYDCLRICLPNKELIIVLFWWSHLYHNTTCKATRGKHAINAF